MHPALSHTGLLNRGDAQAAMALTILAALALVFPNPASGQAARLLDPEADANAYRLVEAIAARVPPTRSLFFTAKPWSTADVRKWIGEVDSLLVEEPDAFVESLIGHLKHDLSRGLEEAPGGSTWAVASGQLYGAAGEFELDPAFRSVRRREDLGTPDAAVEAGLLAGAGYPSLHLAGAVDLRALTNARNRFDLRVEGDGDPEAAVRSAYVTWQDAPLLLAAGRLPIEWGNGVARGLGITAVGPAQDGFLARARFGRAQFSLFSAFLEDEPQNRRLDARGNTISSSFPEPGEARRAVDRYLFGHRVDVRVHDRLALAVEEMALVTGVNRHMPLSFSTGLIPYFALQETREETDGNDINIGVGLQYRWTPFDFLTLYGEFFANEVFIDTDIEQVVRGILGRRSNKQGFQQGVRVTDPFGMPGVDIRVEWIRSEHFLYLHRGMNTNWEQAGAPLGAELGPDQVEWRGSVGVTRAAGPALLFADLEVVRRRRGVGRISDFEDIQGLGGNRSTPRGPEESWWIGQGTIDAIWPGLGEARVLVRGGSIDDLHNVPGEGADPLCVEFSITVRTGWRHAF